MERYTSFILKHRKMIIVVFVFLAVVCAGLSTKVGVNYKFADYLPNDAASTVALDTMEKEYSQPVPNMRVVIHDVTIPQALDYKKKLEQVDGVDEVNWLDDVVDIYEPLENADQDTIDEWYKDSDALYSITVVDDETEKKAAVDEIRDIIGDDNSMSGTAVTDALSPFHASSDIQKIMLFVLPVTFIVLLLTTNSWFEPVLFMITIGIAIMLNRGTNLLFGEISFVTNAAGSVLQLAVSMDYFHLPSSQICRKQSRSYGGGSKTVHRISTFQWPYNSDRFCGTDPDAVQNRTGYGVGHGKSNRIQSSLCTLFPAGTGDQHL